MGSRIQYVASVIFALAFIALMSMMNSSVFRYGANVNSQINNQIVAAESYELQSFDGTLVTGDTVRSAVKNRDTIYTSKLTIQVETMSGIKTYAADSVPGIDTDTSDIELTRTYKATLDRNANDIITGVTFSFA